MSALKYKVYIPSKGRANTCNTPSLLSKNNIDFFLVVEPQDKEKYLSRFENKLVLVMEENDKGIAYARRFCKKHSVSLGDDFHWQIDDDFKTFMKRVDNKNVKCDAIEVLFNIEDYISEYINIGMAGPKHSLFAWSAKQEVELNKQICGCGLFNNKTNANWCDGVVEDTDYSMQVLSLGYCSVLFNRLLFDTHTVGSNEGGNSSSGHYKKYFKLLKGLQARWKNKDGSNVFEIVEKKGEPRIKANRVWTRFKQEPRS
tara:strand:+ start:1231 stop:2001 length:771 start_codon:yes stop_codon:yes gene_type:complete